MSTHPMDAWIEAVEEMLSCLGPGGYHPAAGKPTTDRLRETLASMKAARERKGFTVVECYEGVIWLAGETLIWDTRAAADKYIEELHAHDRDISTARADYRVFALLPLEPNE